MLLERFAIVQMKTLYSSSFFYTSFQIVLLLLVLRWRNIFAKCNSSSELSKIKISLNEDDFMTFKIEDEKQLDTKHNILIDTDDFRTLRLHGSVFVDKSEMINEYLERGGLVLAITRPRKWGKSINIDMFKRFFEIEVDDKGVPTNEESRVNSVLFTGGNAMLGDGRVHNLKSLKISQFVNAMDYHGKNPVIVLSLKNVRGSSYDEFENAIAGRIGNLYMNFPYLSQYAKNKTHLFLESSPENHGRKMFNEIKLENSLYYLSKLLFQHFDKNVYIFIDDYDTPIANAYMEFGDNDEEFRKISDLTYTIIMKGLKDNYFLERAILTGTYHFGWINEILKLHDVRHSTIIDMTFSKFYGFTKEEVDMIITKTVMENTLDKIKEWYNGYDFDGEMVYNPWSTLSCLSHGGVFNHYWGNILNTSSNLMKQVFLLDSVQEHLHHLLQGKVITRKDINKPINLAKIGETFHRILLFGGYLNPRPVSCAYQCYIHPWNLSIPNREVRNILAEGVSKWVANKLNISVSRYLNLTHLLVNLQIDYFSEEFEKYLLNLKISKVASEQQYVYHQLMSGIFSSLASRYTVESKRLPGQRSREYVLIAHPDLGNDIIIIEYEIGKSLRKLTSTVEAGLKRLLKKDYKSKLKDFKHVKQMIKIYMAVWRQKVSLKYQVFEIG